MRGGNICWVYWGHWIEKREIYVIVEIFHIVEFFSEGSSFSSCFESFSLKFLCYGNYFYFLFLFLCYSDIR